MPFGSDPGFFSSYTQFDSTPDVVDFAKLFEWVCVDTVESGDMTKDLALLISLDQKWLTTGQFMDKLDENLQKAMGDLIAPSLDI